MTTPRYRERRRRAKLGRRARDRDVSSRLCLPVHRCRGVCARQGALKIPASSWWTSAEGRRAWFEADRTVKLASKCPPLSVMQWAKGRGYPAPWGSDVFAAYKEHIRAALVVLGRA